MGTPSDIPGAREILSEVKAIMRRPSITPLDQQIVLSLLDDALEKMVRATALGKARASSSGMNPALAQRIKTYCQMHPAMSLETVGAHFRVKGGRVSEARHGHWDPPHGMKYLRWLERNQG